MAYVNVSIDDEHLASLSTVVSALQAEGMQVEQVLDAMGIVTGVVADEQRPLLAQVPGVASVDGSLSYSLPSPAADVQ